MATQRVMIVEDDPHFGGQLADLFKFQGYEVDLLANGDRFMQTFLQRQPSVVILDLVLPGTGGVELVRQLRGAPTGGSVPIFLMSAVYRQPRMFERELRQLGIVEFLAKPFSPIDLGRKVDALLDSREDFSSAEARVTATGSWRLEEIEVALGEGPAQIGLQSGFDRRSLLDTFVELFRRHSAGCLSLTRGDAQRDIYFLNGYPVAAESGEDSESLISMLLEMGLLDRAAGDNAVRVAQLEGQAVRDILLKRFLVTERKLKRAERARVRRIVINSFGWSSGTCEFESGEGLLSGRAVAEVNPVSCLSEVVEHSLSLAELFPDIEARMDQVLCKGARYGNLVSYVEVAPGLRGLLDCFEGNSTIGSLFETFSSEPDALTRVLWLMLSLGIVEGKGPVRQPSPSPAPSAQPPEQQEDVDLSFVEEHHRLRLGLDYYNFLGLERSVRLEEIEAVHAKLAALYAPHSTNPEVEEQLKDLRNRLQVSFKTLSDPTDREHYDQRLSALDTGEWTWPLPQD